MNKKKKKKNNHPKFLYHHTSLAHLKIIEKCGYLKTTESNLLPSSPGTQRLEPQVDDDGEVYGLILRDDNCGYKPVVWLTSQEIPDANSLGLYGTPRADKTEVTIVLPYQNRFIKWRDFADANKMDAKWRYDFEKGRQPNTWYVCRTPIDLSDATEIRINKPVENAENVEAAEAVEE